MLPNLLYIQIYPSLLPRRQFGNCLPPTGHRSASWEHCYGMCTARSHSRNDFPASQSIASRTSLSTRPIFLRLLRTFGREILCNVCAFWPSTVVDRYWYARSVLGEACRASRISTLPWETANQNLWPIPLRLRSYCSRLIPLISNPN
jgi:hypothetical protein